MPQLPRVLADGPLAPDILELLDGKVQWLDWQAAAAATTPVEAVYTYGHPRVDGTLLDRLPGVKVISNYGVGVDHIDLAAAGERGIPVGNTPGILDGATADMGFCLLLAAARRLVEGDRYARSPEFTRYDPGYILGREVHRQHAGDHRPGADRPASGPPGSRLRHAGALSQSPAAARGGAGAWLPLRLARRAAGRVRLRDAHLPAHGGDEGADRRPRAVRRMKPTATLINISRGPVVDTAALTRALAERRIASAALDVTDPEPLPRDHPLLKLSNVIIAPHLGSATVQTRRRMAEMSVENLLAGLAGQPLPYEVRR